MPLRNVSVEAWIDSFAADVTLTQVFVNQENNPIEAIYVFPIEVDFSFQSKYRSFGLSRKMRLYIPSLLNSMIEQ